jgi:hypothetical protein
MDIKVLMVLCVDLMNKWFLFNPCGDLFLKRVKCVVTSLVLVVRPLLLS